MRSVSSSSEDSIDMERENGYGYVGSTSCYTSDEVVDPTMEIQESSLIDDYSKATNQKPQKCIKKKTDHFEEIQNTNQIKENINQDTENPMQNKETELQKLKTMYNTKITQNMNQKNHFHKNESEICGIEDNIIDHSIIHDTHNIDHNIQTSKYNIQDLKETAASSMQTYEEQLIQHAEINNTMHDSDMTNIVQESELNKTIQDSAIQDLEMNNAIQGSELNNQVQDLEINNDRVKNSKTNIFHPKTNDNMDKTNMTESYSLEINNLGHNSGINYETVTNTQSNDNLNNSMQKGHIRLRIKKTKTPINIKNKDKFVMWPTTGELMEYKMKDNFTIQKGEQIKCTGYVTIDDISSKTVNLKTYLRDPITTWMSQIKNLQILNVKRLSTKQKPYIKMYEFHLKNQTGKTQKIHKYDVIATKKDKPTIKCSKCSNMYYL
uniref:Uncharacterized protein n=1 Tax=Faxonius propinquus nudivirus TaxID=3139431 RepID=A0AAU8GBG6_9VIRU